MSDLKSEVKMCWCGEYEAMPGRDVCYEHDLECTFCTKKRTSYRVEPDGDQIPVCADHAVERVYVPSLPVTNRAYVN